MSRNFELRFLPIKSPVAALRTILTNYQETGTVLISTHLISDVEKVLDEAIFLKEGKIMLHGTVDNLREREGKSVDDLFREIFRAMWKHFSLIWGAAFALSLVNRVILFLRFGDDLPINPDLFSLGLISVIMAMFVISIRFVINRFSKGPAGQRGLSDAHSPRPLLAAGAV